MVDKGIIWSLANSIATYLQHSSDYIASARYKSEEDLLDKVTHTFVIIAGNYDDHNVLAYVVVLLYAK